MERNVIEGIESDVRLHRIAQAIAAEQPNHIDRMRSVYDWLGSVFVFKPDARGYEQIRSVGDMLDQLDAQGRIAGDCDDLSIIGAALLLCLGFRAGFTIIRRTPAGPYAHVYPCAFLGKVVVPIDPQERTQFGQDTPGAIGKRHYLIDT